MSNKYLFFLGLYSMLAVGRVMAQQNATEEAIQRFNTLGIVSTIIVAALWALVWWRRKKRNKPS